MKPQHQYVRKPALELPHASLLRAGIRRYTFGILAMRTNHKATALIPDQHWQTTPLDKSVKPETAMPSSRRYLLSARGILLPGTPTYSYLHHGDEAFVDVDIE